MGYVKKKMGEEKATSVVVPIAKRVHRANPEEPLGILVGAVAVLFLAGFTDPKDRHVLHAADRLRDTLADDVEAAAAVDDETRQLSAAQNAEVRRLAPRWYDALAWAHLSLEADAVLGDEQGDIEAHAPTARYELWLQPFRLAGRVDKTILIYAPHGIRAWAAKRYSGFMVECLNEAGMPAETVRFVQWRPVSEDDHRENANEGGTTSDTSND
jgi:hypothetical protein